MATTEDSLGLNDGILTSLSAEGISNSLSKSAWIYSIIAWSHGRSVDTLPVISQPSLDRLGFGATAAVMQSYVNPRMELAYKPSNPDNLQRFFRELQILSIPKIQTHSFMARLEGLSWSVDDLDNSISPSFVFEKSRLGNLETFMHSKRGASLQILERLALSCQIATALHDLQEMGIIHGDLKPKNVLVYEEPKFSGALVVRVTDFGHATAMCYSPPGKDGLVYLPQSRPWSIPPPEYHHRGFTFQSAAKAMVYSLGACCLWLLFYNHYSNTGTSFPSTEHGGSFEPLEHLARTILNRQTGLHNDTKACLFAAFNGSLTLEVGARADHVATILAHLKRAYETEHLLSRSDKILISERYHLFEENDAYQSFVDSGMAFPRVYFSMAMHQLLEIDYRIRQGIFKAIKDKEATWNNLSDGQWHQHCCELALCYWVGFGTRRDEEASRSWLEKSKLHEQFNEEVSFIQHRKWAGYSPWTSWTRGYSSDVVTTSYNISYYLGRHSITKVLEAMRSELEDWKLALGHDHWIVLNRLSSITLFELARQPRQALQTAQAAYDLASSQSASALAAIQEARLNLAIAYEANGMMDSAGKLAKEFIHILEQPSDSQAAAMSSNSAPNTDLQQIIALARARSILASVFESTSKLPEAENLRREVLSDVTEALGETHGLSLEYTSRLAQLLFDHGKKKESRQLFKRVEDKASSSWSSNHDLALLARQNLHRAPHPFWWYHRRSHPERFRKEMIENYQLTVGNYNRNTIAAMDSCVQILLQEFRWEEALNLMEHAVALSAFAYRDDPKQIHIYQENLKNVRRMCFWSSTKISQWFIKYRFGYTIMPYHLFRPIGTEEFQRRYQHAWGPFYRVKTMFEAKDFYRFDPYKDPDHPGNNEMVAAD